MLYFQRHSLNVAVPSDSTLSMLRSLRLCKSYPSKQHNYHSSRSSLVAMMQETSLYQASPALMSIDLEHPQISQSTQSNHDHGLAQSMFQPNEFLGLPREIRDIIYEYALTASGGISTSRHPCPHHCIRLYMAHTCIEKAALESNQLRYVCSQLHTETNALELRYNTIYITRQKGSTVYEVFNRFMSSCSDNNLATLRRVIISDDRIKMKYNTGKAPLICRIPQKLAPFPERNAHITFIINFEHSNFRWYRWKTRREDLLGQIHTAHELLRGGPLFEGTSCRPRLQRGLINMFSMECPENVKFLPVWDLSPIDIRRSAAGHTSSEEELEEIVNIVEQLKIEGI